MRNRPWTEAEESRARQMKLLGHSYSAIGEVLGRTRAAIERKLTGQNRYKLGRSCNCGASIGDYNKSGRCKSCNMQRMNGDPATKMQRGATVRRKCQSDPLYRAKKARVALANKNAAMRDPTKRANMMRAWLANLEKAFTPEALARKLANQPEGNRKLAERKIAWCPPEYRDLYRHLVGPKKLLAKEARQIVADEVRRDRAKRSPFKRQMSADRWREQPIDRESLSPFERQERALANGARLVANDLKPTLANPGIYEERKAG